MIKATSILTEKFFARPAQAVAYDCIGCILSINNHSGVIVEAEAYGGNDDPASHAYKKRTPRNSIMFGPPGLIYVYMIYGKHYCFNMITEINGRAGSVFIRAVKDQTLIDGPGKFTKAWDIDMELNNTSLINNPTQYLIQGQRPTLIKSFPRIGIRNGKELLWRFRKI